MDRKKSILLSSLIIIAGLVAFASVDEKCSVLGGKHNHLFHQKAVVDDIIDIETIIATIDWNADSKEFFTGEQLVLHCPHGFSNIEINDEILFYFFLDDVNDNEVKVRGEIKTVK